MKKPGEKFRPSFIWRRCTCFIKERKVRRTSEQKPSLKGEISPQKDRHVERPFSSITARSLDLWWGSIGNRKGTILKIDERGTRDRDFYSCNWCRFDFWIQLCLCQYYMPGYQLCCWFRLVVSYSSRADFYTSYTSGHFGYVKMIYDDVPKIVGMRYMWLETRLGYMLALRDVRRVLDIRHNLIPSKTWWWRLYISQFSWKWKLNRGLLVIAIGIKINNLHVTRVKLTKGVDWEVNAIQGDPIELMARCLSRLSKKGLPVLAKSQLLPDMKGKSLETSSHCLVRKIHILPFRALSPPRRPHTLDFNPYLCL